MAGTRLVLIMGGGVSLGTYIAGALTEIFWALRNLHDPARRGPGEAPPDIQVEVLAGSSAGAVSAAVFARALTGDPDAIYDLYHAWVRELSLDTLIAGSGAGELPPNSLFSTAKIDELADTMIVAPPDHREWQSFCADPLRIGITLSNLGGVRYRIRYANDPTNYFSTTVHRDQMHFELNDPVEPELWDALRAAAVASAAFPAAFPPRQFERARTDYEPARFHGDQAQVRLAYLDGGVFDNEPIGMAKDLVDKNPEHQRLDYRYILIDPFLDGARDGENAPEHPIPDSLAGVLGALTAAVVGQSNAKDWMRANKLNWRLEEQVEFVGGNLRSLLDAARAAPPEVTAMLGTELLNHALEIAWFKSEIQRAAPGTAVEAAAYFDANLARIAGDPRYTEALEGLEGGARNVMLAMIFIIECAAGLRDKEPMDLYLIASRGDEDHPLAGDFLHNFGGFFRESWREHDFLCGRRDARRVLTNELLDRETGAPLFAYPEEPGVDYDPAPISATARDIRPTEWDELHRLLKRRIEAMLTELSLPLIPRLFRGTIASHLAGRALRALGRS